MNSKIVEIVFYETMKIVVILSAPLLLVTLIVGLVISFFQAATQINEQTLSFIPKMISVLSMLIILGPWMFGTMFGYMQYLLSNIPLMINS